MQYEKIETFLSRLGLTSRSTSTSGWVRASCPLAPWRHAKLSDSHPSFAISISEAESFGVCKSCGFKGTLRTMVWALQEHSRQKRPDLMGLLSGERPSLQKIEERVQQFHERRPWASSYQPPPPKELPPPVILYQPEGFLRQFTELPAPVRAYLRARHVTDEMVAAEGIVWHGPSSRIIIPLRDETKRLVGVSRRLYTPEGEEAPKWNPKFRHSLGTDLQCFLYGEHEIGEGNETLYLVEGFFDRVIFKYQQLSTLAIMGGSVGAYQIAKIKRYGKRVMFVKDGDRPGRDGLRQGDRIASEVTAKLRQHGVPCQVYDTPEGYDPDDLPTLLGERFHEELAWRQ